MTPSNLVNASARTPQSAPAQSVRVQFALLFLFRHVIHYQMPDRVVDYDSASLNLSWICLINWLLSWNDPARSVACKKTQKSMLESPNSR